MPEVQMPHWSAACSRNFCCSGCSFSPSARPSMVLISAPSDSTASIRHEQIRRSSTVMLQAPQSPEAQPSLEPVSPSGPRSASSMVSFGSHKNSIGSPLMVVDTCSLAMVFNFPLSICLRAFGGDRHRALQEHAGDLGAISDGAALVVDRTAGGGTGSSRGVQRSVIELASDQCFRGGLDQQH